MYLILNKEHFTFHLQYKYSGMFANCKYEELSYPKNQKMCNPILVTLLKMRPHDSQSSRENATPSSGTSPLASYKEVPPPPPRVRKLDSETIPDNCRVQLILLAQLSHKNSPLLSSLRVCIYLQLVVC